MDRSNLCHLQKKDYRAILRVKATIAYNGAKFYGSQIQERQTTVNGTLSQALASLGINSKVEASGRTDRGVHASAQVIHFDLPSFWSDLHLLKSLLNQKLPKSLHVKQIQAVADDFHARYSATRRVYRYILKEGISNPFLNEFVTFVEKVDFTLLQTAIKEFEGTHDFCGFYKKGSDNKTTIRTIYKTCVYGHKGFVVLYFEANGFLRSQIRLMVAMLLGISSDKYTIKDLKNQLTLQELTPTGHFACKQKISLKPAPSNGLYLAKIFYS